VFVMENVRGILSARLGDKPVNSQILKDLQQPTAAIRKTSGKRNGRGADVAYRTWSLVKKPACRCSSAGRRHQPISVRRRETSMQMHPPSRFGIASDPRIGCHS
jgi:hypothetical protein